MNSEDMNKSKVCAQLWNGVVIKPSGCAGICCEVTVDLEDMHVRTHTFDQMQNHPRILRMRQDMLEGKEPPECWRCFSKEKLGAHSLRHSLNDTYFGINGEFDPSFVQAQNVEFVLGNLCQLRCVMCSPVRSKKVDEQHKFIAIKDMRKSYEGHVVVEPFHMDVSWVEDPKLWDNIAEQSVHARRIYINGGEPLLAREHEKVLKRLIEQGVAQNTLLVYSTNGLLLSDEHLELWQKFKRVSIAFSLDDLHERNHFIRYPSDWGQVVYSLDRVARWKRDPANDNIDISMWCAINLLSYVYLDKYIDFFGRNYPDLPIAWRAIQSPAFLNPANLPLSLKMHVMMTMLPILRKYPQHAGLKQELDMILKAKPDEAMVEDGTAFMLTSAEHQGVDLRALFGRFFGRMERAAF
jgi:organic radical activating enzyme